jgi:hypothetical protein
MKLEMVGISIYGSLRGVARFPVSYVMGGGVTFAPAFCSLKKWPDFKTGGLRIQFHSKASRLRTPVLLQSHKHVPNSEGTRPFCRKKARINIRLKKLQIATEHPLKYLSTGN